MATRYMAQVRNASGWAGNGVTGWQPAIAGTLNQTRESDEEASTFATREFADYALDMAREQGATETRIVEVE